ncbi:hypothetical protein E4H12_14210 [Candidatus Thorarchaeota archaeon]|nr:MAG: hypothetical protein E4H12_14210 [Candidatus Thorarchaeota archaeon]
MARKKKPEGETPEQTRSRRAIETISNAASRSEKVSWDRKMDNMVKLMSTLRPLEDQILELMAQKQPIFDEIAALRADMIVDCVHPFTHVIFKQTDEGDVVSCKFCMKNFSVKRN